MFLLKEISDESTNCRSQSGHFRNVQFEDLPANAIGLIFGYLEITDFVKVATTCKFWHQNIQSDTVWKFQFLKRWYKTSAQLDVDKITWKKAYKREKNWEKGNYKVQILEGHSASVGCLHFSDDQHMVSGSVDTRINIWDQNLLQTIKILRGHSGSVKCIFSDKLTNSIISGSDDKSIKIWEYESGKLLQSLVQHTAEVNCLQVLKSQNLLITGGGDRSIKIWDCRTWTVVRSLVGHQGKILCLQANKDIIVSGCQDKTVKLWNLLDGQCIDTMKAHTDAIRAVQFDEEKIIRYVRYLL